MEALLSFLLLTAAPATPEACHIFAARDYPGMKLSEDDKTISIVWERYYETYMKVITKPFGVLQEAGVEDDGKTVHVFSRTKVDGKEALIFESMIFFPDCG